MSLYRNSKQKLRNIQRTIDKLLDGDFPLSAGKKALEKLREVFTSLEGKIDRAYNLKDKESIETYASNINLKIDQSLPILGFILRSTNVRNAFEFLDPLQKIADEVLQGQPKLLLSSEWDYVPFAYPQSLEDLKSFVLIGMPASEAASALLIPLAGHELGHAVWRNRGIGSAERERLQTMCEGLYQKNMDEFKKVFPEYNPDDIINKEILPEAIQLSAVYAGLQAEELFCDMFAYGIFGESYLFAFSYIIAPGSGRMPSPKYPSHKTRISTLINIATAEGVTPPDIATLEFAEEYPSGDRQHRFIVRMAETSVDEIKGDLWKYVIKLISEKNLIRPDKERAKRHLRELKLNIPAHEPACLGDIIIAGWMYYRDIENPIAVDIAHSDKVDGLNEMILKTVEVLEYRRRTTDDT